MELAEKTTEKIVRDAISEAIAVKQLVLEQMSADIFRIGKLLSSKISAGGTLYFCGNGGSAADAQHLATEMLVRLRPHVNRQSLPSLSLAIDTSMLTACGNDFSFDEIFAIKQPDVWTFGFMPVSHSGTPN